MNEPVRVLWTGEFGKAVAEDLAKLRVDCESVRASDHAIRERPTRMRVFTAWRPSPEFCESLDQISHELRRPFFPLVVDGPLLRLGPVVIPGEEGCWRCWQKRSLQHDPWRERHKTLHDHYFAHPEEGPQGYLRPFAMMGAARVAQLIDEIDAGSARGGYLWQIDMITREIVTARVVGVDGCVRCGLRPPHKDRSVEQMKEELMYLWTDSRIDFKLR
jgi:bacteriocin biosynthesis cyclodehydratase domain-containing protein